jgi:hypothetical protein
VTAAAAPSLDELVVAAEPERWAAAGFHVEEGTCRLGRARVGLAGEAAGRGIRSWSLRGIATTELDGLPTERSEAPPPEPAEHPNGALGLDHVVAFTPNLDRTVTALERAGLDLRRIRDEPLPGGGTRQAFFRLGEVILEAIERPQPDGSPVDPAKPARLWGVALLTADLDATAGYLGERLGAPRDAVQPGRRIATVRRSAGLGAAVAFITPAQP